MACAGSIFNNVLVGKIGAAMATLATRNPAAIAKLPNGADILNNVAISMGNAFYLSIAIAAMMGLASFFIVEYKIERELVHDQERGSVVTQAEQEEKELK